MRRLKFLVSLTMGTMLHEILSLQKTSNVAQVEKHLFVTKIIKPNGARMLKTVFVKTSEIKKRSAWAGMVSHQNQTKSKISLAEMVRV